MFDQSGTILHPIAAVVIGLGSDLPNDRAVNVTAKHSVDIETLCITNDRIFVSTDETDGVLHGSLGIRT